MVSNYTNDTKLFLIDGIDVQSQYGAVKLEGTGFLDIPKRKASYSFSWPDEHGTEIDLDEVYFESKDVKLRLLLKSLTSLDDLKTKNDQLISLLSLPGLRHLKLPGISGIFPAYYKDGSFKREQKGTDGIQRATVELNMTIPHPVIRNFYSDNSETLKTVTFDITTLKDVFIEWGDGEKDSVTASGSYEHTYTTKAQYCIVVYGTLSGIASLTVTNATEI